MDSLLDEFWSRYQDDPSPDLRDRLVLQYAPLVKFYAGREPGDPEMAVQRGLDALTTAISEFQGCADTFESYASEAFRDAYSWDEGWLEAAS